MNIILNATKIFYSKIENDVYKLKKDLAFLNADAIVSEDYGQISCKISFDERKDRQVKRLITNFLINIYCIKLKREYLYKHLNFSLNDENLQVLIETLVAFDRESDVKYVKRVMKLCDTFSIDGFFNFRLKELIFRWESVVQITKENSVLLSDDDSFNLLLRFLLSTVKPKYDKVEILECSDGYKVLAGQKNENVVLTENELMLKLVDIAPIEVSCAKRLRNGELFCKLCDIFDVVEHNGVYGFS